jgi:hypothetical protein
MIGAAQSISLVADGSLIASPCFQKYLRTSNVTELDATNQTLQAQQIDNVQAQFGSNPYAYTPIDANTSVTASEVYEPDVLGVSLYKKKVFIYLFIYLFTIHIACFLDLLLCCLL